MPAAPPEFAYGHLKLRHLQLLTLLHRERSITRAAQALHLTQPAVSAMLKELEAIFGFQMVQRSHQGVSLTVAALAALRRFSVALAEVQAAHGDAVLADRHARLRLRVGALTVAMLELIPQVLSSFVTPENGVQIEIVEGTVDGLTDQLMGGELDFVVGRVAQHWAQSPDGARIERVRLSDEPRCIVCRKGHPLAGKRALDLARIAQYPWILPPAPSSSRLMFDQLFLARGLMPPAPAIESASVHSNLEMAAVGDFLAVAPVVLANRHAAMGRLRRLSCRFELDGLSLSAIWRATSNVDPLAMAFRDALVSVSAALARRR